MGRSPEDDMSAEDLAALRAEYEAGASALSALAGRFSISTRALSRIAQRMNFGARPPIAPFQRRGEAKVDERNAGAAKTCDAPPAKRKTIKRKTVRPKRAKSAPARAAKRASPAPPEARPDAELAPLELHAMAGRLRLAAERELVKINDQLEAGGDVERQARVLASLVKTLGDLVRLAAARDAAPSDDPGGWSLDDLRATLARRIDALAPEEPAE